VTQYYVLLITGIIGMVFIISKFNGITKKFKKKDNKNNETVKFNLPNLSWKKDNFKQELGKIRDNDLENYKKLLKYDNIFALCYSSVYFSLNQINDYFIYDIIKYTIPVHILFDWMENYIASKMIDHFKKEKKVKYNKLYFSISNIKWTLAIFNTGTALYSIYKIGKRFF